MADQEDTYRVELQGFTDRDPAEAAAELAAALAIPLEEAQGYVELVPIAVTASISNAEARKIAGVLLKIGATIKVHKNDPSSISGAAAAPAREEGPRASRKISNSGRISTSGVAPVSSRVPVVAAPPPAVTPEGAPPPAVARASTRSTGDTDPCTACKAPVTPGQRCQKCGWNEGNRTRWCTKCGTATALRDARLRSAVAILLALAGLAVGGAIVMTIHTPLAFAGAAPFLLAGLVLGASRTTTWRCPSCGLAADAHLLPDEERARAGRRRTLAYVAFALFVAPLFAGFLLPPTHVDVSLPGGRWSAALPWFYRDTKSEKVTVPLGKEQVPGVVQTASAEMLFQIWRLELPGGSPPLKYESSKELLKAALATEGLKMTAGMEAFGALNGIEFDFKGTYGGKEIFGRGQIVAMDRVAAIILYGGPTAASVTDPDGARFLESFARAQ